MGKPPATNAAARPGAVSASLISTTEIRRYFFSVSKGDITSPAVIEFGTKR
jgi:hypothetical protein